MNVNLSDFDYHLPPELIAQHPAPRRHESRMMLFDRKTGQCAFHTFGDIGRFLQEGDCLIVNNTKVIPARLNGKRPTGGNVEILLLEPLANGAWQCMMKPGRRMRPGEKVYLNTAKGEVIVQARRADGTFEIIFEGISAEFAMREAGDIPLPPYIQRACGESDSERYQTVYAETPGAIAAPTAGLHFTQEILEALSAQGVRQGGVTLHVGPGTFQPVKVDDISQHIMHEERFELGPGTADLVNDTRRVGGRVIAVGTTSVRVLESCWDKTAQQVVPQTGRTRLFMHPPMRPQAVNGLLTNFHLPKSTLLMLVSTFSSTDKVMAAYHRAVAESMRFYSYGDCMLIL